MKTAGLELRDTRSVDDTLLSAFCEEMLASLSRSDQRRWGKAYVRGLVNVPGRKSIRRMSRFVVGQDADQSLQQFLNQSPWNWAPVRCALAGTLGRAEQPAALVVREVTFPKHGSASAAVARQYSRSLGRLANCQLATSVFIAGESGSCPVNWRLHIPREWDTDVERRLKSRVPESERWQPSRGIILGALDEMTAGWHVPRLPVVVSLPNGREADLLLAAFEARGIAYLAKVAPNQQLSPVVPARPTEYRPVTAQQAAVTSLGSERTMVTRGSVSSRSLFTLAPAAGPAHAGARRDLTPHPRRRVLADWSGGPSRPRALWLTNLADAGPTELVRLTRMWDQSTDALDSLRGDSGLLHFEGRSFPGWHHHVTLVALAHGFRWLCRLHEKHMSA